MRASLLMSNRFLNPAENSSNEVVSGSGADGPVISNRRRMRAKLIEGKSMTYLRCFLFLISHIITAIMVMMLPQNIKLCNLILRFSMRLKVLVISGAMVGMNICSSSFILILDSVGLDRLMLRLVSSIR